MKGLPRPVWLAECKPRQPGVVVGGGELRVNLQRGAILRQCLLVAAVVVVDVPQVGSQFGPGGGQAECLLIESDRWLGWRKFVPFSIRCSVVLASQTV